VRELLGMADPALVIEILSGATSGDGARTMALLQQFYDAGGDVRQLVRALLSSIRDAALLSVGANPSSDGSGRAALERIGRGAGRTKLLALWKGLMEMEPELRKGADARLLLEVTLLSAMSSTAAPETALKTEIHRTAAQSSAGPVAAPEVQVVPTARPESAGAAPTGGSDARWEALKQQLPRPVASLLSDARLSGLSDSTVRIEFTYKGQLDVMQRPDKKEVLLKAARAVFGPTVGIELVSSDKAGPSGAGSAGGSSSPTPGAGAKAKVPLSEDPLVKEAMNRFDAVNVRVTPGKGR
jgi:DNA polymerase III gamma/tau subunit